MPRRSGSNWGGEEVDAWCRGQIWRGSREGHKLEVERRGVEEKTSMGVEKAERDDKYEKG